jgi:hypothetical protein
MWLLGVMVAVGICAVKVLLLSAFLTLKCRAGGLKNELGPQEQPGGLVFAAPDTFGLPPRKLPGSILRKQVMPGQHS